MSTVLKPVIAEQELTKNNCLNSTLETSLLFNKCKVKHGINHKENYFKHKCNKSLKNKLKKYKLRRDGKEDPDVVNVSQKFQCSLRIKSPSNNNNLDELTTYDIDERPKNYLFKMGKRNIYNVKSTKSLFKNLSRDQIPESDVDCAETDNDAVLCVNNEDRKHTNAFKLMMDSRNKSIGSNSPGKEKHIDENNLQSLKEEKHNKAKRLLVLQKMAEAKGSLKKKEKEELLEEAIRTKMEKRAQRLTNMLVNNSCNKQDQSKKEKLSRNDNSSKHRRQEKLIDKEEKIGTLNLINMFLDSDKDDRNDMVGKKIPTDLEFIKKLSPSIRKKENMLCYFKKLEKSDDDSMSPVIAEDTEPNSPIIKVKFAGKNKKKSKKQLSLKTGNDLKDENKCPEPKIEYEGCTTSNTSMIKNNLGTRKRKREQGEICDISEMKKQPNKDLGLNDSGRPKRNVKKPIQYKDDFVLSSSDEEYNIFTPKKKKHMEKKSDTPKSNKGPKPVKEGKEIKPSKSNENEIKKHTKTNDHNKKNNVKLAPIFAPRPLLDPEALEAKQKFLQSGVPEKLKKIACQQKQTEADVNSFPTVVHVQQGISENSLSSSTNTLDFGSEPDLSPKKTSEIVYKELLSLEAAQNKQLVKPDNNVRKVLQNLKHSYPKFPVYRTYHLLKSKSKGEYGDSNFPELDNSLEIINNMGDFTKVHVDRLNWTDKYKPMAMNQIIGNFETIKELKKWLESWSVNDIKKRNGKDDSDSSDFCYTDPDSRDSIKTVDNLLILTGPTGCGKTASVYAVAAELAIKVIEVNASSKRNGKIMIQDLQEATQSHKVNRAKGSSSENSQKSQEMVDVDLTIKAKKRGRPKKCKDDVSAKPKVEVLSQPTNSQESVRTVMSLILIDDADIVFDQDDGFCSAINQLVQYSKRPVVLITASLECTHLQRFLHNAKVMKMRPLLPRMLGTWLDIMCLADSSMCWPGLGSVLLDVFKGDIRKTINCLQFYASTHKQSEDEEIDEYSSSANGFHDENSSMSWAGSENQDDHQSMFFKTRLREANQTEQHFMEKQMQLVHMRFPLDFCDVWWNLPNFINITSDNVAVSEDPVDTQKQIRHLNEIADVVENVSVADYLSCLRPDTRTNICSQPWYSSECDSSSEYENVSYYSKSIEVSDDISQTLIVRSICNAQKRLQSYNELYIKPTSMAVHRERDRIVSRHDKISAHLNPAALLDRRALALDYWSSCRTICRFEKTKTDTNSKRNNRYCHYLRSLKIMCNSDVFDKLGKSLNVKEDNNI